MKNLIMILFMVGILIPVQDPAPNITTKAVVKDVYDGDTITVVISKEFKVRLLDCWAPEITGTNLVDKAAGIASRDYLRSLLQVGDEVLIEVPLDDKIGDSLTFGRILGKVWKDIDNDQRLDNISSVMVGSGYATRDKSDFGKNK